MNVNIVIKSIIKYINQIMKIRFIDLFDLGGQINFKK